MPSASLWGITRASSREHHRANTMFSCLFDSRLLAGRHRRHFCRDRSEHRSRGGNLSRYLLEVNWAVRGLTRFIHEGAAKYEFEALGAVRAWSWKAPRCLRAPYSVGGRTRARILRIPKTPRPYWRAAQKRGRMFREEPAGYPLEAPKARAILRKLLRNGNEAGR